MFFHVRNDYDRWLSFFQRDHDPVTLTTNPQSDIRKFSNVVLGIVLFVAARANRKYVCDRFNGNDTDRYESLNVMDFII